MRKLTDELAYQVLSVVEEIPSGKVASYGQIATLIRREKNSRLVGKILSRAEYYGEYPCHRVVNHAGRLAPGFAAQKSLLLAEGVPFKDAVHVDMKRARWDC
ncbi:MAG TPA: DNA methyltransferase [Elusimicrobia bacterium]|nr:DNA methyltransferase [Elusimicrobiota bacterium]